MIYLDEQISDLKIVQASEDDILKVFELEKSVEKGASANSATLWSRYEMFKHGFLVAKIDNEVVGYLQSCLWDKDVPHFEERPEFFADQHNDNALTLYIIFIGVKARFRRYGIASRMISSLVTATEQFKPRRLHAVCRDEHLQLYAKFGFSRVKELPGFLPDDLNYTLMEKTL